MKKGFIGAHISERGPLFSKENRERARQERMNEMFVMKKVGRKISELRKAKNMTQLELADKMNVSFQAVSNWERGNSMPDISKLPELAEIFGTSIDVILGAKSELIESAAEGKLEEYVSENKVSVEELKEAAPILKPDQVGKVVGSVDGITEQFENMRKKNAEAMAAAKEQMKLAQEQVENVREQPGSDIERLSSEAKPKVEEQLEPAGMDPDIATGEMYNFKFSGKNSGEPIVIINGKKVKPNKNTDGTWSIDTDTTKEKNTDSGDSDDDSLDWLLPYLSDDDIGEFADRLYEAQGIKAIINIAETIDEDLLGEIAIKEVERNGISGIIPIAEYLDEDKLGEIALAEVKKNGIKDIIPIAEYIDEDELGEIAMEEVKKNGIKDIIPIAEYVEEGVLGKAVLYEVEQNGIEGILPIAEYIDEDNLGRIAVAEVKKNGIKGIVPIAELLDEDWLAEIAMDEAKSKGLKAIKPIIEYLDEDTVGEIVRACRKQ